MCQAPSVGTRFKSEVHSDVSRTMRMWSFWVSFMKGCGLSSIRPSGGPCRGASHVTAMKMSKNEDPGNGASRRRANSGGQAVVTIDEFGSGDSHVVQKDIVGELISNWLVTTLAALGFFLAMCGWTVCCADCLRPKRESMHAAPSESWRAPVCRRRGCNV